MSDMSKTAQAPRRLLLATDLSARCDRALDRSAQLASEWGAELVALHVLDPATLPNHVLMHAGGTDDDALLRLAHRQLAQDLRDLPARASMHVVRGRHVAHIIEQQAAQREAELVVCGVARDEMLGRFLLGSTTGQLVRSLNRSVLVVRNRARGPYGRIVVAVDFSEASRRALQFALRAFPGRQLTLYHAHVAPMAGTPDLAAQARFRKEIEAGAYAQFIAACALPAEIDVRLVIGFGEVEAELARHVREQEVELVVAGPRDGAGLAGLLLGRSTGRMIDWLPCDVLVVRGD